MPHPEREHSLQIEVARLRKEADDAHTRERSLRTDLAAARRECDLLRAENGQLRELLQVADEVVPSEYRDLRSDITAALGAPAAASGEEGKR